MNLLNLCIMNTLSSVLIRRKLHFLLLLVFGIGLFSCATNPYAKTNRSHKKQAKKYAKEMLKTPKKGETLEPELNWVGTTNFNLRKPNYVVLHHTAQNSVEQTLHTFTLPRTQVSSHYVISRDGTVYQMLNDYFRSWHAGVGSWGGNTDLNSSSIGIELDNNGFEEFPEAQIESLLELLDRLKKQYRIPAHNFIGHSDLAPGRKVDPNANFPWKKLADNGFGLWYDQAMPTSDREGQLMLYNTNLSVAICIPGDPNAIPDFSIEDALKIIGYDISNLSAAIQSFKLHYISERIKEPLNEEEKAILYKMYQTFLYL